MSYRYALIPHLLALAERKDRGAMAALRRGLGKPPGTVPAMMQYVTPWIPEFDNRPGRDGAYYLVASLFASHSDYKAGVSVGAACRQLGDHDSNALRFARLLEADAQRLPYLLRQVVSLIHSSKGSVGLDHDLLLHHVRHWTHPSQWVQKEWARAFWRSPKVDQVDPSDPVS